MNQVQYVGLLNDYCYHNVNATYSVKFEYPINYFYSGSTDCAGASMEHNVSVGCKPLLQSSSYPVLSAQATDDYATDDDDYNNARVLTLSGQFRLLTSQTPVPCKFLSPFCDALWITLRCL
jgi:hypothetical protein